MSPLRADEPADDPITHLRPIRVVEQPTRPSYVDGLLCRRIAAGGCRQREQRSRSIVSATVRQPCALNSRTTGISASAAHWRQAQIRTHSSLRYGESWVWRTTRSCREMGPVAAEPKLHFGPMPLRQGLDPDNAAAPEARTNPNGTEKVPSCPTCRWGSPQRSHDRSWWKADMIDGKLMPEYWG